MARIDDITLMAYADGELDPMTCAEVEAVLAHDAELRDKVRGLRESTALVRAAFNHVLYEPLPEIRGLKAPARAAYPIDAGGGFAGSRSPSRRRWSMALPLAASLAALTVGALVGHVVTKNSGGGAPGTERLAAADETVMGQALLQGLEKELSGTAVTWRNPVTGNHGAITPVRTFRAEGGQYCREFEEARIVNGETRRETGIACRGEDGAWRLRLRYFPPRNGI